jgi:cellulose synthase/poly-beta-1,6-N-acetylglucosamine synthase-like glycosyltransferase
MRKGRKSPALILLPIIGIGLCIWLVVLPRMQGRPGLPSSFFIPCVVSAIIWLLVLWWAAHHAAFQVVGLIPPARARSLAPPARPVRFAVFYMTCDDFLPACCDSCRDQDYTRDDFRVFVCDDSLSEESQKAVAEYCGSHEDTELIRREVRTGFKAGNLNHAFKHVRSGSWDWIVIADADQTLPKTFLRDLAPYAAQQPSSVAFIQAGREPVTSPEPVPADSSETTDNHFQDALEMEMVLFFERDMGPRAQFGFLPFLGHGGAVRTTAWEGVDGFPEAVSEDFAFALRVRSSGALGVLLDDVRSRESHPKDFGAFLTRWGKFAGGAAEILRCHYPSFLFGRRGSFTERFDAAMLLATYALMPLYLANLFLSAYLCHRFYLEQIAVPSRSLSFAFLAILVVSFSTGFSVARNPWHAIRFWFWSYAVYMAALPTAAGRFVWHLIQRPGFHRTPKGNALSSAFPVMGAATIGFGAVAIAAALAWPSPFRFILASAGIAFASFPLYAALHAETPRGWFARIIVYVPGLTFLIGFREMCLWR